MIPVSASLSTQDWTVRPAGPGKGPGSQTEPPPKWLMQPTPDIATPLGPGLPAPRGVEPTALRLMQLTPDIATTPKRLPKKGAASHSKHLPCVHPYKFCLGPHPGATSLAPFSQTSEARPGAFPNKACLSSPPFFGVVPYKRELN